MSDSRSGDSQLRCFIAVPLPGRIKKKLSGIQSGLRNCSAAPIKAGWPGPSGFHLTLSFIGEVSSAIIPDIEGAMAAAAAQTPGFTLRLGALGVFPRPDRARVLWVGVDEGGDDLKCLHQRLVVRLKKLGLPMKKQKFSPHITLARIKVPVSAGRIRALINRVPCSVLDRIPIEHICLYKSRLARSGAVHTCLCASELSGGRR